MRKEVAIPLSIAWYIKVELLCTQQLPPYMKVGQFDRVPALKRDNRQSGAECLQRHILKCKAEQFIIVDTERCNIDGRFGTLVSYGAHNW